MAKKSTADKEQVKNHVAVYVRVSTEEQAQEGISLKAQVDRCKAYCEAKGWTVFKVYQDAGFSAGSLNRPAFELLMRDANESKFSIILVYKVDRFSRKLKDLITIMEKLKEQGINFTSVTEQIDTTSAMGEAFFQIIGVFAQLERGMIKDRVELAFGRKVELGEALSRAPLGYKYVNKKLVVDEETAEKVRDIFAMWAQGVNYKDIAAKFNLPVSTLYNIIKNPTYIGKVKYKDMFYKGSFKAIIDEELFNRVNGNQKGLEQADQQVG